MKIAICDNCVEDALSIKQIIQERFKNNIEIIIINSSAEFLEKIDYGFDIVIMDIMLDSGISGIELIQQVLPDHSGITVIFVSSNPEFFIDVYCVDHIYFLTKPIDKDRLLFALKKASDIYSTRYITLLSNGITQKTDCRRISYIEARRHQSVVYFPDGSSATTSDSITQLSEQLKDCDFIRCHKSFCANMNFILEYTKSYILMDDRTEIPIGRLYTSETKNRLLQFWGKDI